MLRQPTAPSFVASPCAVEPLEVRRLLAASVVGGVLYVDGTDDGEQITVRVNSGPDPNVPVFEITVGAEQTTLPTADVRQVVVRAGAGDDSVLVDVFRPDTGVAIGRPAEPWWFGPARVEAGDGDDVVDADNTSVMLGGAGDDRLTGSRRSDVLRGGAGNDRLLGGEGRDALSGGSGDDSVDGGEGRDRVDGGAGRDVFAKADARSERLDLGSKDTVEGRVNGGGSRVFVRDGVLHLIGTNRDDDIFVAQSTSPPNRGPEPGATAITGFIYFMNLDGGSRHKRGSFPFGTVTAVRVEAGGGNDLVNLTNWDDLPNPEEGVAPLMVPATVLGGDGPDVIYGGTAADRVSGGDGDDAVTGGYGPDEVSGDGGRDTFYDWDLEAELVDREADEPLEHLVGTKAPGVDPALLNMRAHGGMVDAVSVSSRYGDADDPAEALGNPTGPAEPGTFIFADNGPGGTETMIFHASRGVTLAGLRITGGGAGAGAGDPRTVSTVSVWGGFGLGPPQQFASLADFNDPAGFADILFERPVLIDHLSIQFGTPEQGARVIEIDAIVPEPG